MMFIRTGTICPTDKSSAYVQCGSFKHVQSMNEALSIKHFSLRMFNRSIAVSHLKGNTKLRHLIGGTAPSASFAKRPSRRSRAHPRLASAVADARAPCFAFPHQATAAPSAGFEFIVVPASASLKHIPGTRSPAFTPHSLSVHS